MVLSPITSYSPVCARTNRIASHNQAIKPKRQQKLFSATSIESRESENLSSNPANSLDTDFGKDFLGFPKESFQEPLPRRVQKFLYTSQAVRTRPKRTNTDKKHLAVVRIHKVPDNYLDTGNFSQYIQQQPIVLLERLDIDFNKTKMGSSRKSSPNVSEKKKAVKRKR